MARSIAKELGVALVSISLIAAMNGSAKNINVGTPQRFSGMCDASGAVPVSSQHFVVANDEDNVLRVYDLKQGGKPLESFDCSQFLGIKKGSEADLEAGARVGELIFWISSHGRNKNGKESPARHQFFATTFSDEQGKFQIAYAGKPYTQLLNDLIEHPALTEYKLREASQLPPKARGGFNIEGLCATPEGYLLIGLRNPVPQKQALLIPLLNPRELIEGKKARFDNPILLDLGGLGIRELLFTGKNYLILAGAYDSADTSHLFQWDGKTTVKFVGDITRERGNPEALILTSDQKLHVVMDNGSTKVNGTDCKDLKEPNLRYFQVVPVELQQ